MTIAIAALALALAMGTLWLVSVLRLWMGKTLPWLLAMSGMAVATALVALVQGGLVDRILAGAALPLPIFLCAMQLIAEQPPKPVAVRVGGAIKDFEAFDGDGEVFALRSLAGSKYLLKFYRGHW